MKKVALSLLAFALVGAVAFAEDAAPVVKLSGYVDSGVKYVKVDTADGVFSSYAKDYDGDGAGTVAKATVAVTGANYGATATLRGSDVGASTSVLDTAKAWFSPVEGLTAFVGTGYNDAFDDLADQGDDNFWANKGFGATFGASGFVAGVHASPRAGSADYGVGVAYAQDKLVSVRFSGKTAATSFTKYNVSASLLAVENLTLAAGYFASAVDTSAVSGADVVVSYAVTPAFSAGVVAYDYVTAEYFTVKPNVSYVVVAGTKVSAGYKISTEGKGATPKAENEINAEIDYAVGGGTLKAFADYLVTAKTTTLNLDYTIAF